MVGREYEWAGRRWRVLARWAPPAAMRTWVFPDGETVVSRGVRAMLRFDREGSTAARCVGGGAGPRNVLIEDVVTGERVVRPFRGLRKPRLRMVPDRRLSALGWELRTKMAKLEMVRLVLSDRCDNVRVNEEGDRILQGAISSVSPTNAFCVIMDRHVPLGEILAVVRPHFAQAAASDPAPVKDDLL